MNSPIVPDWDDIGEDDQAEPDDADVPHTHDDTEGDR